MLAIHQIHVYGHFKAKLKKIETLEEKVETCRHWKQK